MGRPGGARPGGTRPGAARPRGQEPHLPQAESFMTRVMSVNN